jgi:hypothetical protein
MTIEWKKYGPAFLLVTGLILVALLYLPGLHGPWLVDDDANIGVFNRFTQAQAPYHDIIFSNNSGPLGRPVAMATFAANHSLGLFSTPALKLTNLLIHLGSGTLLYFLLSRLFFLRTPEHPLPIKFTAALISVWWLLLPVHISSVLYIVQRMTLLAGFLSLASTLLYVMGRQALQNNQLLRSITALSLSLFLLFPLAIFSKESAFSTLAWLVLIELFFFNLLTKRPGIRPTLIALTALVIAMMAVLVAVLHLDQAYIWRNFSLSERLLTEPRVLWAYIHNIFLPTAAGMGVYQDDFPLSRGWLQPWGTLPAVVALASALIASLWLAATRWWLVSFGVLFYLSGHLIESTVVSLEIYFEHRNYLPSIGLLISASSLLLLSWPWRRSLLALIFSLYLSLLAFITWQQCNTWGTKSTLLEISALNHPHSLRAWTDYSEDLLVRRQPQRALEIALLGAENNSDFASISYMQMVSIYCRIHNAPPPALIEKMASALNDNKDYSNGFTTPLGIGLENILSNKKQGFCQSADFSPLASSLIHTDLALQQRFPQDLQTLWFLRLAIAEWLLDTGRHEAAVSILRDAWHTDNKAAIPMVGLILARALSQQPANPSQQAELQQVLGELHATTSDAPTDFRAEVEALQQGSSITRPYTPTALQ